MKKGGCEVQRGGVMHRAGWGGGGEQRERYTGEENR